MAIDATMVILRQQVGDKGQTAVARELAISRSALSLLLAGKYGASTSKMETRVRSIYGHGGKIPCPVLKETTPSTCATNYERARKIGLKAGNPATLRLFKTCLNCPIRKGGK